MTGPLALALLLAAPAVEVGLERLLAEGCGALRGKRVGLLAHAASVTADGRHAREALRGCGANVVCLFAPEHGFAGKAAAGQPVPDVLDPESGLPVVGLYGAKTKPTPEDLRGLDILLVDLQDAGVRFYTYAGTMLLALDAAAEAGVEALVLDRPNPLGGERLEGPAVDPGWPSSLGTLAPGPLVHGLTLGEMARFANARRKAPARLSVIPMRGWKRAMTWRDTGRSWVPPSPNLRSAEAALAYPGTALLEATNLSEGRGTPAPFLLLGAPWLDTAGLARAVSVPGFALSETRFTPQASAAAPRPKYAGEPCRGLRVSITDAAKARPYALGLALLAALRGQPGFRWLRDGATLDALLGTRSVREALERGGGPEEIARADAAAIEAFCRERAAALLY